jgi:hypothetical protein
MRHAGLKHGSAKIYQFPTGGRSALGGARHEVPTTAPDIAPPLVSETACGGNWYHEAAIEESKAPAEH